jgi:hypothetical protein
MLLYVLLIIWDVTHLFMLCWITIGIGLFFHCVISWVVIHIVICYWEGTYLRFCASIKVVGDRIHWGSCFCQSEMIVVFVVMFVEVAQ